GRRLARDELVGAARDPSRCHLAEAAAHLPVGGHGPLDVVVGPAELELAVLGADGPGSAAIPVQRHPDAAGVEEIGAGRTGPQERLVTRAEHDYPLGHAGEHPRLAPPSLRREALVLSERR